MRKKKCPRCKKQFTSDTYYTEHIIYEHRDLNKEEIKVVIKEKLNK